MVLLLLTYPEDCLISLYIVGSLLVSCFVKRDHRYFLDHRYQKRLFFLLCQFTFVTLIATFLITSWDLVVAPDFTAPSAPGVLVDSLNIRHFYNVPVNDIVGNCFFRKDFFVSFLHLLLNSLVLFYLFLIYEFAKSTPLTMKYLLEVPILIMTVFLGFRIFLMTYDFMLIVIALELTAFCSIILICLQLTTVENVFPFEAAIKYFIFNAVSISLLLFAVGGYYSLFKSLNLLDYPLYSLLEPVVYFNNFEALLFLHSIFFTAYFMKLGAVPFHQWVPDVYEGAELIITAFLVFVISPALNFKLFVFAKLLLPVFEVNHVVFGFFLIIGALSIIFGSLNAFAQVRIKRFLAYTGLTHLGYMLLSFGTATFLGFFASFFYLFFYILTNCVFFTLLVLSRHISGLSLIFLTHLKNLLNDNFLLFAFFLIPLFSFAGFPPFAGFFSKLFILLALLDFNHFVLVIFIVFYILISAYLYLRFIKISIFEKNSYTVFLPLRQTLTTSKYHYYHLATIYRPLKKQFLSAHHLFLFLLFLLNSLLLLFIFILPTVCLILQQPLLTLFLLY